MFAVDPGREKCGWALLAADGGVSGKGVVRAERLTEVLQSAQRTFAKLAVVVGSGTGSQQVISQLRQLLEGPSGPAVVDERGSTLEARRAYFADHPSKGWRRLLPISLQTPPQEYDDYVAIILGRRYLAQIRTGEEKTNAPL